MRITKETLSELNELGITAKIYPDDYDSFFKRLVEKRFQWLGMYDHCQVRVNDEWIEQLYIEGYLAKKQKDAEFFAKKDAEDWYNADVLYIEYDGKLICKKENVKNKLITTEYVLNLVEKDKKLYEGFYGEFALKVKQLLRANGMRNEINVYPTSYGIGVWVFWWHGDGWIEKVRKILDNKNVEYYNEYSDARWVYRFKISKRKENIAKLG